MAHVYFREHRNKKRKQLAKKGDLNTKIDIVEKGLLDNYSIDKKGKKHVFMFAPEGWLMSYEATAPADLYIEALETSLVRIEHKNTKLDNINPSKLGKCMANTQKRVIMLMSATAMERYAHSMETYPDITQKVPQKMIASYLGISPEACEQNKKRIINPFVSTFPFLSLASMLL